MHALTGWRSLATRRFVTAIAFGLVVLLGATFAIQFVATSTARAATALLCDQNTIYGVDTNGKLESIDATTGTVTSVGSMSPATNGLGISSDGAFAYGFQSGANAIAVYNATSNTASTVATADPANTNQTVIRGAVNPVNGFYYYASNNVTNADKTGSTIRLGAYDPATGKKYGQVGTITGMPVTTNTSGNGDLAFSTSGTLFLAVGNQVWRVDTVPTTSGTPSVPATLVTTLSPDANNTAVNSPGIAFTTDGYLYVTNTATAPVSLIKINPANGDQVAKTALSDTAYAPLDLATCNYPDTAAAQVNVAQRWSTTDEFTVNLASTSPDTTQNASNTTTGNTTGDQKERAGSVLALPGRQYSITEGAAGSTKLSHYSTSWSCTNANDPKKKVIASGNGTSGAFTFPATETGQNAGTDVVCTFTNALVATHSGAQNDTGATVVNTTLDVAAPGVLKNDQGTELSAAVKTQPTNGTVTMKTDGSYTYVPNKDFSGTDTFTYTASDSSDQTTQSTDATVTITVTPTAANDSGTTTANTTLTQTTPVTANDHGTGLTTTLDTQASHGTATLATDGTYTYVPSAGYSGPDSFTYIAKDSSGQTAPARVDLTVTPTAAPDSVKTTPGQTVTVPAKDAAGNPTGVLANDAGSDLTAVPVTGPAHGTLSLQPDGGYTYTPTDGYAGQDSFTYQAKDGSGQLSAPVTVTITVGVIAQPDTENVLAGVPTTVPVDKGVLANDQGKDLTATVTQKPTRGDLDLNKDGSFTYTPTDPQFSGKDTFTYTATDPNGQSDTATVTVIVLPSAVGDTVTVADGSKTTGNVLSNDHGTAILVTPPTGSTNGATTGPDHGTLDLQGGGAYAYTPTDGYSGPDQFTYTITDSSGNTSTATVAIAVKPAAGDDTIMTTVGSAGSTKLLANDHGSALTITEHTVPKHGDLTIDADGTATFTPDAGYSGKTTFTYTVTDSTGQTATATVRIVVGVVTKPDTGTTPANTPLTVDTAHGVLANDQGSAVLTAAVVDGPEHGNVKLAGDGSYVYTPIDGYSGPDSFTYSATDPDGVTATNTVSLSVTPTAKSPSISVADGSAKSGNLLDGSAGDSLTTTAATPPAHGTLDLGTDGTYTYTPTDGYSGPDTFTVTVTDRTGQTTTITVTAKVTPAAAPHAYATMSGADLSVPAPGLLADAHGDAVTVTGATKPGHGSVSTAPDGSFTYSPVDGFSGTDTFDYTVTDRTGQKTTATVTVTVGIVTKPDTLTATTDTTSTVPVSKGVLANDRGTSLTATVATSPKHGDLALAKDGSYTYTPVDGYSGPDTFTYTATDGTATKTETVTITVLPKAVGDTATVVAGHTLDIDAPAVLANDDGTGISVTGVTKPANGTATVAPDGTLQYTPAPKFSGTDTFTYTITDKTGGAATATVTITVTPRAVYDEVGVAAGSTLTTTAATGVLANDLGTALTVTAHTEPTDGQLSIQPDGSYTYTPNDGFSGTDTFTYTLTDGAGHSSTTTVIVIVGTAATADSATTSANTPLTVGAGNSVLLNDKGTKLTATVDLEPTHGTLVLHGDGTYEYTPVDGYSGHDRFTYTATDPNGNTSTGIVTITVLPKAVDDRLGTSAGKPITFTAPGPLKNDIGRTLKVSAVGTPAHGTATITPNGALVYTPSKGYSGNDAFTYQVTDITGGTATATVFVGVTPVATNDTYTVIGGQPLKVSVGKGVTGDDDGSDLRVTLKTQAQHGTVTLAADGSFVYTPDKGYSGPDSFEYTATDADGQTTSATVNLVVAAAATAANDAVNGVFGQPATIDVLANDVPTQEALFLPGSIVLVDPNGGGIATSVTVNGQGTWTVVDGKVRFEPVTGFTGAASIDYRVTDGDGVTVSATITVTYPTAAAHVGGVLAYTGGASLLWLAIVALAVIGLGVVIRRRRNGGEAEPGPRRS